jgi:hypothetical protein
MLLELNHCETPELEVERMEYGGVDGPRFSVDIADQPIALSVRELYSARGLTVPADYALFTKFALWLVPHRVSVRRLRGLFELVSLAIDVQYDADGGTCSVVSLFPEARFRTHGSFSAQASVSLAGNMAPLQVALAPEPTGDSLSIGVSGGAQASLSFRAHIATPLISTGGVGSSRCYWNFERDERPLFGCDVETWSIVLLAKRKRTLQLRMKVTTTERLVWVPVSRSTDEVVVNCKVVDGGGTAEP